MRAPDWSTPVEAREPTPATTLLERGVELAALAAQLAETRQSGGRIVLVSGEAGIGKSGLLETFVAGLPRATGVLRGACDPIEPPRPFAPIDDIARRLGNGLREALADAQRDAVIERFLAVLRRQGAGSVVILEDLHWADSATLELLRVVGRRLSELRTLVVATYRTDEVGAQHPVRQLLGDLPPRLVDEIRLAPLSVEAVAALARADHARAADLHAATGGNPFFVTEVIASGGGTLPVSVRDAVSARVGRLSEDGQNAVRAVAILGSSVEPPLVSAVVERARPGVREALERGILEDHAGRLAFRHELARQSVLQGIPASEQARLHHRALAALRSGIAATDPVHLAHHAIEAGDATAIVELVPEAAAHAAGLGAHLEAADYLAIALAFPDAIDDRRRGELLERYAHACSLSDRVAASRSAQEAALDIWRRLGDQTREGAGLRALAGYMWHGGEGDRAREVAESSVALLETVQPHGHELAWAYAKFAQLLTNSGQDDARAQALAENALALADRFGNEPVAVHALTTLGALEVWATQGPWTQLAEALERARAAELAEDEIRILINFVEAGRDLMRYDVAERYGAEAIDFFRDHELELYRHLLLSRMAQIALERGRWADAEREAVDLLAEGSRSSQGQVRALEVLGRLRARRAEAGAMAALDQALSIVGRGELQDLCPLLAARAECAWLAGDEEAAGVEASCGLELARPTIGSYWYSELSFWAWRGGRLDRLPDDSVEPYALHALGRHRAAAQSWADIGRPYDKAAALADSDAEADLRESLAILHPLGARALAGRVERRLRDLGAQAIPRGPRPSTQANPFGLTTRENDVLALIRRGASNADIAQRLVLSPKTVDHHVSAVLRKLRVPDRAAARREAERLGIQDGESARPD